MSYAPVDIDYLTILLHIQVTVGCIPQLHAWLLWLRYVAASYGSEQIWTCMVLPSTIIVTACAVVARSTSLGHLYMPQVRWSE